MNPVDPAGWTSSSLAAAEGPFSLSWKGVPQVEVYFYCRLQVPLGPENVEAFFAGGMDLLMERYVLPNTVFAIQESGNDGFPDRLIVARTSSGALVPVEKPTVQLEQPDGAELNTFMPAVASWRVPPHVGSRPPAQTELPLNSSQNSKNQSFIQEPGRIGGRPPSFVERPMSIREGLARKNTAQSTAPTTPLAAYEQQVKPRQLRASPPPDLTPVPKSPPPVAPQTPSQEEPASPDDHPIRWVALLSPDYLQPGPETRKALRKLRGYVKVAVAGIDDRAFLVRRMDRVGVPVDAIVALPPESDILASAIQCTPRELVVVAPNDVESPQGIRRIDAACDALDAVVTTLVSAFED
jgi:hypothetical protein